MLKELKMYTVSCDECGKTSGDDQEISGWNDKAFAEDEALESGWMQGERDATKHYCPECLEKGEEKETCPICHGVGSHSGNCPDSESGWQHIFGYND